MIDSHTDRPDATAGRHEPGGSSRRRLLDAAATLFHDDGYHKVSLDRVLRTAGVVRSNFYYHFRSKEALCIAVVDAWLERLQESVVRPALADSTLSPLVRVRRLLEALIDELESGGCRGGCPFGSLASAEAEHNERFREKLIETFDGFSALFQGLFAEALRAGELPDRTSAARLSACALSVVQGGFLLTKAYGGSTPFREAAAGFLALLETKKQVPM